MPFGHHIAKSLSIICIFLLVPAGESAANGSEPRYVDANEMGSIVKEWNVIKAQNDANRQMNDKAINDLRDKDAFEARRKQKFEGDKAVVTQLEKGTKNAKSALDALNTAIEYYKSLTPNDDRMKPNYEPPGAPQVPSQCVENGDCLPCYERAQAKINKTRKNLEKVRAISDYTNGFAKKGQAFLNALGGAGPYGIAAIEATHQVGLTEAALGDFNKVVAAKYRELLPHIESGLHEISACESKYYKNDDWYNRYGFIYYQFMVSRYESFATPKPAPYVPKKK